MRMLAPVQPVGEYPSLRAAKRFLGCSIETQRRRTCEARFRTGYAIGVPAAADTDACSSPTWLTGRLTADGRGARAGQEKGQLMSEETGKVTGTADKDYNLIWFTEQCLSNALRLETYIADAERAGDNDVADLFRRAQADSRKGGEQGKKLLANRLQA